MDEPLPAHSPDELRYYLMVTRCPSCSKGPWTIEEEHPEQGGREIVRARCNHCGHTKTFRFICKRNAGDENDESRAELINPTANPSGIIDLSQWLSLFYMLIESASSEKSAAAARLQGYRAALCLEEALKFYAENELPPESAFFSEQTLAIFREHPEKFARQKLRDMQGKLPSLSTMAERITKKPKPARKKWWPFGKRKKND
jgi:hypothetical protein